MTASPRFVGKMVVLSLAMWLIVASVSAFLAPRVGLLIDAHPERCLPEYTSYLWLKQSDSPKRGEVVLFAARGMAPFFKDGERIGKRVVGLPGDTVTVTRDGVWVNDQSVANGSALADQVSLRTGTWRLGSDEWFVVGEHARSFDSRYWGPVHASQWRGRLIPLF